MVVVLIVISWCVTDVKYSTTKLTAASRELHNTNARSI